MSIITDLGLSNLNPLGTSKFSGVPNNASIPVLSGVPQALGAALAISSIPKKLENLPSMGALAEELKGKLGSPDEMIGNISKMMPTNFDTLEDSAKSLAGLSSMASGLSSTKGLYAAAKKILFTKTLTTNGYTPEPGSFWDTFSGQTESPGSASAYPVKEKAYFKLDRGSLPLLKSRGFQDRVAKALIAEGFWEFIIQSYNESHSEGYCLKNAQSDTFTVYATGANPVQISMSGHLYTTPTLDHRIDFLHMYNTLLRGTKLADLNLVLSFYIKDTVLKLRITDIVVGTNSATSDVTTLAINAIGYKYRVRGVQWATNRGTPKKSTVASAPTNIKAQLGALTGVPASILSSVQKSTGFSIATPPILPNF